MGNEKLGRRDFIRNVLGAGAAMSLGARGYPAQHPVLPPRPLPESSLRKLVVVLFGGGTRSSEAIDDPEHRYIPHLWNELVPRGTLFTNMRVEGKVVHPNSAGSIATGHWEWDDIDWSRPVAHPSLFEIFRKERGAEDTEAWAFVYASILAKIGESAEPHYGVNYAANVVEPPTIPRKAAEEMDRMMHHAAARGSVGAELEASNDCARLVRSSSRVSTSGLRSREAKTFVEDEFETWKASVGTTSHDAFLTDRTIACMKTFSPSVIYVGFGEIDCAHYGSWSRYVEAIRRTDELTHRLWQEARQIDAYRDRTLFLILPDHGREMEESGGWGFIHHSDFYTNEGADEGCRRVWMLALGPGVTPGKKIDQPVPITTVAATGLEYLGLEASPGAEKSILSLA